jgi:hypothetical protein
VLAISLYCDLICSLIRYGTDELLLKFRQTSLDVIGSKKLNLTASESKKLQLRSSVCLSVCLQGTGRSGNSANGASVLCHCLMQSSAVQTASEP